MNYIKRLYIRYEEDGIFSVVSKLLKKIGIKTTYNSLIHKKKINIYKRLKKLTKNRVINGYYKSLKLSDDFNWNKGNIDLSSKLLGTYEEQVQKKNY
jgi:hypothetical protein